MVGRRGRDSCQNSLDESLPTQSRKRRGFHDLYDLRSKQLTVERDGLRNVTRQNQSIGWQLQQATD